MSTATDIDSGDSAIATTPAQRAAAREQLAAVGVHVRLGEFARAQTLLDEAAPILPDEAEVARLRGLLHHLRGELGAALGVLRTAHRRWPDDAAILGHLAGVLRDSGDIERAIAAFRRVCEIEPARAPGWYNLGVALVGTRSFEEADAAFLRALECAPDHVLARLGHADMLVRRGDPVAAVAAFRAVIAAQPGNLRAWTGLAISAGPALTDADVARLRALIERAGLDDDQRDVAVFALARGLEGREDFEAAQTAFDAVNARRRQRLSWNAAEFSALADRIADAFATPAASAVDADRGHGCIMLVGLPGATSAAAIAGFGAHPDVGLGDGSAELVHTIQEESNRRGMAFPEWVATTGADDWQRLGRRYLERTARWRRHTPVQVDIALGNWPFLGAAMAMLPGLRVIDCRDDALETCWTLYRTLFNGTRDAYSYALDDVAAHWRDHERLMLYWHARYPRSIGQMGTPLAGADGRKAWRDVLAGCGLAADDACAVGAARAAQLQPLAAAARYGARLNPLRRLLDLNVLPT